MKYDGKKKLETLYIDSEIDLEQKFMLPARIEKRLRADRYEG